MLQLFDVENVIPMQSRLNIPVNDSSGVGIHSLVWNYFNTIGNSKRIEATGKTLPVLEAFYLYRNIGRSKSHKWLMSKTICKLGIM